MILFFGMLIGSIPMVIYMLLKNKPFMMKISLGTHIFIMFGCFLFATISSSIALKHQDEKDNLKKYEHGEVFLYTNDIGCNKFKYYDSVYYRCPNDKTISEIEETRSRSCGKSTCTQTVQIPVIKE